MPDVTGFMLEAGLQILMDSGFVKTVIKLTTPPRDAGQEYNSKSRIVKQRFENGEVELIVSNIE